MAQIAKVSEALLYRLGNVAGGDGSNQRDVRHAGPISLPSDPYAMEDDTDEYGYDSLPESGDKYRAVRFGVVGFENDRLEFRLWAGDAGELTGNPALWQVRSELSAAMMLAGTDSAIYRPPAPSTPQPGRWRPSSPGTAPRPFPFAGLAPSASPPSAGWSGI
ncbi:hypothetical protein [Saccharopolyspora spinosa]|uniref:hypothetical protein n=1 Tax=Saccharopolyspora spinosa TaxID=60894 RepID=UPI001ED8C9CD|nr:hypothetical protein [Saccharopolyspora spinosa]